MHFGFISSPVPGHLNPLCTLARELVRQGHKATFFNIPDTEKKIRAEGLDFAAIGENEFPKDCWEGHWLPLARRSGLPVLIGTTKLHTKIAHMMCREIPPRAKAAKIDALVIDQLQFQGRAIADHLGVPFVSVSCTLVLNRDLDFRAPPPFLPWDYAGSGWQRALNRVGWRVVDTLGGFVLGAGDKAAEGWGREKVERLENSYSPLAQIVPMPRSLDFPARFGQPNIHYAGSFVDDSRPKADFPFERLDGRPLIYASFGTLQNHKMEMFEVVAEALSGEPYQLVMALGDWRNNRPLPQFGNGAIVVNYAPQLELLKRACLCITHAGPNTVYEALTFGLPMVAFPIANDQPAVGARIARARVGEVLAPHKMTAAKVKAMVKRVMDDPVYRANAQRMQKEIAAAGGVRRAAEIVLEVCGRG
jgi:MGT family glycosyltransferase